MSFHEVRFPTNISYGSSGGPGYDTAIVTTDSGIEQRVSRLSRPRHQYNASYGIREFEDLATVIEFFHARKGAAYGFRYKDWVDYATTSSGITHDCGQDSIESVAYDDVVIGTGDGTTKTFQLMKKYTSWSITTERVITKPVSGTTVVGIDGVEQLSGWSVNTTTGVITFSTAPGDGLEVTAGCEFDVPVRFGEEIDSLLATSIDDFSSGSIPNIPIIEIVDPQPLDGEFYYGGGEYMEYSESMSITNLNGRVLQLDPQADNLRVSLPTIYPALDGLPPGGPHFYMQNVSSSYAVYVYNACDTLLVTIPVSSTGYIFVIAVDDSDTPFWMVLN